MVTAARSDCDRPRALIACGSLQHAPTIRGATHLATYLDDAGFIVELAFASAHAMPTPLDYDVIVVGLSGRAWFDRPLLHWIAGFGEDFNVVTIGAFVIGSARRGARSIAKLAASGWRPIATTVLPDRRHGDGETTALIERFVTRITLLSRALSSPYAGSARTAPGI